MSVLRHYKEPWDAGQGKEPLDRPVACGETIIAGGDPVAVEDASIVSCIQCLVTHLEGVDPWLDSDSGTSYRAALDRLADLATS